MKKKIALFLFPLVLCSLSPAVAGQFDDLKKKIVEARFTLFLLVTDVQKRTPEDQKRVKDTADAVSAMLSGMKAPAGRESLFKELTETWKAFKTTRETELVPAVLSGNQKEAERIAQGIQNDRFAKMMKLCDALEKGTPLQ